MWAGIEPTIFVLRTNALPLGYHIIYIIPEITYIKSLIYPIKIGGICSYCYNKFIKIIIKNKV